jgi:hypothetical protein
MRRHGAARGQRGKAREKAVNTLNGFRGDIMNQPPIYAPPPPVNPIGGNSLTVDKGCSLVNGWLGLALVVGLFSFRRRSAGAGKNGKELDDYIAAHWPNFEVYYAASNVTKAVALAFEGILMRELRPLFNVAPEPTASSAVGRDTFNDMRGAERLDYKFVAKPPRYNHVALWKLYRRDDVPPDFQQLSTARRVRHSRRPPRQKRGCRSQLGHDQEHSPLGSALPR